MKKFLLVVLLLLIPSISFAQSVFKSKQVGSLPVSGYYLQTDGDNSFWTPVSGGGGGADGNWSYSTLLGGFIRLATTTNRVGIGTTSPYAMLSVASNAVGTTTFALRPIASQTASIFDVFSTTGTKDSTITASGKWGIGSSSPTEKLEVVGNLLVSPGSAAPIYIGQNQTSTTYNLISMNGGKTDSTFQGFGGGGSTNFFMQSLGDLVFRTGGINTRMTISSTGNVGIGTTTPYTNLAVEGTSGLTVKYSGVNTPGFLYTNSGGSVALSSNVSPANVVQDSSKYQWATVMSQASDSFAVYRSPAGATWSPVAMLYVDNVGDVGIGTTSPYAKLSVVGEVVGANFTATTSTKSTFPYASSTALTVSGGLYNTSLSDGCLNVTSGLIGSTGSACGAGGGGVSGGTAGMLASWTNSTTLTATGTPTAASYIATSTTAVSMLAGKLGVNETDNQFTSTNLFEVNYGTYNPNLATTTVDTGPMTSDSLPSPLVAAASSVFSTNSAYKAFDGAGGTSWVNNFTGFPSWVSIDMGTATTVNAYSMRYRNDVLDPTGWNFQGSNNNSSWVTLDSRSGQASPHSTATTSFYFTNSYRYRYYRMSLTGSSEGTGGAVTELELHNLPVASSSIKVLAAMASTTRGSVVIQGTESGINKNTLRLTDSRNNTNALFDSNGRLDLTNYDGSGGVMVLRNNTEFPTNNQVSGHYAFGSVTEYNRPNTTGYLLNLMTNVSAASLSSAMYLCYMDNVNDGSGSGSYAYSQPNKCLVLDSAGLKHDDGRLTVYNSSGSGSSLAVRAFNATMASYADIYNSDTTARTIVGTESSTGGTFGGLGKASVLGSIVNQPLQLIQNSSPIITIASTTAKNVGVGTTTPGSKLQVNVTTATSTISATVVNGSTRSTTLGGRVLLQDVAGGTCTEITTQSGVISSKAVTCP